MFRHRGAARKPYPFFQPKPDFDREWAGQGSDLRPWDFKLMPGSSERREYRP